MIAFRQIKPVRTSQKQYKRYRTYKKYLKKDFNARCGYCNCEDKWCGGIRVFHIDHFVPWKRFEATHSFLKLAYYNLVYSCPYCNIFKSDDWVSDDPKITIKEEQGHIDPCDDKYDAIFCRTDLGDICPLNKTAEYIYEKLGLGLERHGLIWQMEKLKKLLIDIDSFLKNPKLDDLSKKSLIKQKILIYDNFMMILDQFHETLK